MRTSGNKVGVGKRQLAGPLCAIRQQERTGSPDFLSYPIDGLDDPGLIVHLLDGDQCGPLGQHSVKRSFVDLRTGDAMRLPIADGAVDVAAQNCLFNIFHEDDLRRALAEMSRVLKPGGRLILSDPVCETEIPAALRADERLRSMCLTGAIPLSAYVERLASAGFGTVEVRARRPYRVLGPAQFGTDRPILLESVEICAIKSEVAADGATVFAGQSAIYFGPEPGFSDGNGIHLPSNQPIPISVATAERLKALKRGDVFVSEPTWFQSSSGGGCC